MKSDVIVGLQHGDEGKGKVVLSTIKKGSYNVCLRFNGGPNAGHTVYHNDSKIILHQIPCGILFNKLSIIGNGCVVDIQKLLREISILEDIGIDVKSFLKISENAHVILEKHIEDDINNNPIGSTGSGIRPVNRDKYDRCGSRIKDLDDETKDKLLSKVDFINIIDFFHYSNNDLNILCEGAQGFDLDIDFGNYPYVTSSHCLTGFVNTSAVPIHSINEVIGVCKIYATYVGKMEFEDKNENCFELLRVLGDEKGSTTGRDRQVNWLNITKLKEAVIINSVNKLIINKCDIIKKLGIFKLIKDNKIISFKKFVEMTKFIEEEFSNIKPVQSIIFSANKNDI